MKGNASLTKKIERNLEIEEDENSIKLRSHADSMKTFSVILSIILSAPYVGLALYAYLAYPGHPQTIIITLLIIPIVILAFFIYYYVASKAESYKVQAQILKTLTEINTKMDYEESEEEQQSE